MPVSALRVDMTSVKVYAQRVSSANEGEKTLTHSIDRGSKRGLLGVLMRMSQCSAKDRTFYKPCRNGSAPYNLKKKSCNYGELWHINKAKKSELGLRLNKPKNG
jgi:hypothetical protein